MEELTEEQEKVPNETISFGKRLTAFAKKNVVMLIALLAAVVTSFIVPPDKAYLDKHLKRQR